MKKVTIASLFLAFTLMPSASYAGKISFLKKAFAGSGTATAGRVAYSARSKTVFLSVRDVQKISAISGKHFKNHWERKSTERVNRLMRNWGVN